MIIEPSADFSNAVDEQDNYQVTNSNLPDGFTDEPGFTTPFIINTPAPTKAANKDRELTIKDLPKGINFKGLDLDNPPGLAGQIAKLMRDGSRRELTGGAYAAAAIQVMAIAGTGMKGYQGVSLSLLTLTLGESASGKERPQEAALNLCEAIGRPINGDIRSDREILFTMVERRGSVAFVIDEAHKVFGSDIKKGNMNLVNVGPLLMQIATSSKLALSGLHQRDMLKDIYANQGRLEKQISAKRGIIEGLNQEHEKAKIAGLELEINKLQSDVDSLGEYASEIEMGGIKNPQLNLMASSTHQKLASIVDTDNIESGFLGRGILIDCGEDSQVLAKMSDDEFDALQHRLHIAEQEIVARLGLIAQMSPRAVCGSAVERAFYGHEHSFVMEADAKKALDAIHDHYELGDYRRHPTVGPLFRRILQRVTSLASILALDNVNDQGQIIITREHVRYALLMCVTSLGSIIDRLKINDAEELGNSEALQQALMGLIKRRLTVDAKGKDDGWRYMSNVKSKIERTKAYKTYRDLLLKSGSVETSAFDYLVSMMVMYRQVERQGAKMRLMPEIQH